MPRIAVTSLVAGALLLPLAAPAAAAPAAGPVGASVTKVTSGLAFGDFTFPLAEGKKVSIQRHVLDPREIVRWNGAGTTVAINESGPLQNFASCRTQQLWRAFPAYYTVRSKQLGTLTGVTANFGNVPVVLFTITSEAIGAPQGENQLHRHSGNEIPEIGDVGETADGAPVDPITPADGCPSGPPAETTTLAEGEMGSAQGIDLIDHNQITIYRHTLPAGYSSGWHSPYDPTFVVPVTGEFTTQQDCADVTSRKPGGAFLVDPHVLVRAAGAAEYLSVSWNTQNGFPVEQPLYVPELPPTECPDSLLN